MVATTVRREAIAKSSHMGSRSVQTSGVLFTKHSEQRLVMLIHWQDHIRRSTGGDSAFSHTSRSG
jgi:hypothetical protein